VHAAFCYTTQHSGANRIISRPVHAHLSDCEKCAHNLLPRAIIIAICNHCLVYMTHNLTLSHNHTIAAVHNRCLTRSLPCPAYTGIHAHPFRSKTAVLETALSHPRGLSLGTRTPPRSSAGTLPHANLPPLDAACLPLSRSLSIARGMQHTCAHDRCLFRLMNTSLYAPAAYAGYIISRNLPLTAAVCPSLIRSATRVITTYSHDLVSPILGRNGTIGACSFRLALMREASRYNNTVKAGAGSPLGVGT
jgi:hypothetical protein